jgi:hypothetical protein
VVDDIDTGGRSLANLDDLGGLEGSLRDCGIDVAAVLILVGSTGEAGVGKQAKVARKPRV